MRSSTRSGLLICSFLLFFSSILMAGPTGNESPFAEFQQSRPSPKIKLVGDQGVDLTLDAIGRIYAQTSELVDQSAARAENAKVPLTLAAASKAGVSEEEIQAIINNLSEDEKKMFDTYLDNEVNKLAVAETYLLSAYELSKGVKGLNVQGFIRNPMKIPAAIKGVKRGGKQIKYTVRALKFLSQYRKQLQAAQAYRGR